MDYLFLFQLKTINFVCNCRLFRYSFLFAVHRVFQCLCVYFPFGSMCSVFFRLCSVFFLVVNNKNVAKTVNDNNIFFVSFCTLLCCTMFVVSPQNRVQSKIKTKKNLVHNVCRHHKQDTHFFSLVALRKMSLRFYFLYIFLLSLHKNRTHNTKCTATNTMCSQLTHDQLETDKSTVARSMAEPCARRSLHRNIYPNCMYKKNFFGVDG